MITKLCYKCSRVCVAFCGGFLLAQLYYMFMLRDLLSYEAGRVISITLSVILGLLNVGAIQIRCISLLAFPMYLGKDGRRVLKGLILTYVVSGPIMNMSLNAREVVRVFACSEELAHNLSAARDAMIARPLRATADHMHDEIAHAARKLRYIEKVTAPIESEIELTGELQQSSDLTFTVDSLLQTQNRSSYIEDKYYASWEDKPTQVYQKEYLKKAEYRCNNLLSQAVLRSRGQLRQVWQTCHETLKKPIATVFCAPLQSLTACDVPRALAPDICDSRKQIAPGLGIGYAALKRAKAELVKGPEEIQIVFQELGEADAYADVQAAKESGDRVKQAFEEKFSVIQSAITFVNACQAILFLRIVVAAQVYHDLFLTNVDFDNQYITDMFRQVERRRRARSQYTLLPLKKMERYRYIDVYSLAYSTADRQRLLAQMLKVLLEVVTATTFVMLDRLFYEALDVVHQHAQVEEEPETRGLDIEVEGTGIVANTIRAMVSNLRATHVQGNATNSCLPHPRIMPAIFYLKIYGGYLWVLFLLGVNPYTLRLRRLICSYFYPRREKQRVLHLYNDILKKRIKLDATLRRKAVQVSRLNWDKFFTGSVRAHYLSGESLLLRFPHILGWLRMLPAARMTCLICGEIEPRNAKSGWRACAMPKCPFLYCNECWLEVRGRCLACDPSLAELSDQDSLSDDELPVY